MAHSTKSGLGAAGNAATLCLAGVAAAAIVFTQTQAAAPPGSTQLVKPGPSAADLAKTRVPPDKAQGSPGKSWVPSRLTTYVPGSVSILKLDPNPVEVSKTFTIVVRISNFSGQTLGVWAGANTNSVTTREVQIAPKSSQVLELPGFFLQPGAHDVAVKASWRTGQTILVPVGPTGPLQRQDVWAPLPGAPASLAVYATGSAPPRPQLVDLGPDTPETIGQASAGGVVGAITGTSGALYAIPKTGGVWKALTGPAASSWKQLAGAPPRAYAIAVDPSQPAHIAVGERSDDNGDALAGRSGLWESTDAGASWSYLFDPGPPTGSQAVASVAYSRSTSTLIAATSGGVLRIEADRPGKPRPAPSFSERAADCPEIVSGSKTLGPVTAVAASDHKLWARSKSELFVSADDGKTWTCSRLPHSVQLPDIDGKTMGVMTADYDDLGFALQSDRGSLAATDDRAFVVFKPFVANTDRRAAEDPKCDPKDADDFDPKVTVCHPTGHNSIVSIDASFVRGGIVVPSAGNAAQWTDPGDGRGLGGVRFLRMYTVDPTCPDYAMAAVGKRYQLMFGQGQDVQQSTAINPDGTVVFDGAIGTNGSGARNTSVHADVWDFYLPPDYCPSKISTAWLAGDGGVYLGHNAPLIRGMDWDTHNQGLRAHNAHNLVVVALPFVPTGPPAPPGPPVGPYLAPAFVAYPTGDNGAWWRETSGTWGGADRTGDINNIAGDAGGKRVVIWRQLTAGQAVRKEADGGSDYFTLNQDEPTFDGPSRIRAIQSLPQDAAPDSLDMVMLATLPLHNSSDKAVKDPSGGTGSGTRPALIRNPNFNDHPDGPGSSWSGWSIVSDNLPVGARRFWVSGGHASPTYFLVVDATNPTCKAGVFRLLPGPGQSWQCLRGSLVVHSAAETHGPIFVNPFDPNVMIAEVHASTNHLEITLDGGANFCPLPALTALLTESGRYQIGEVDPGPTFTALGGAYHGGAIGNPAKISFSRENPREVIIASPVSGLYVGEIAAPRGGRRGAAGCQTPFWHEPAWRDLSQGLAPARSYVTSAVKVKDGVYLSTEGRGAYGVSNVSTAPVASFFETIANPSPASALAVLKTSDGQPLAWGRVRTTITDQTSGRAIQRDVVSRTDDQGEVFAAAPLASGSYVVDLAFLGDGSAAVSAAKFRITVN